MITARTMAILEDIGLAEEIIARGTIVEGVDLHFNHRYLAGVSMDLAADSPCARFPFPFILGQPEIETALEHILNKRGGKVERNSEVTEVEEFDEYVEVTLRDGRTLKGRYLVGCDGAHSAVRHSQKEWKFEGHPLNIIWAQCDGTIADPRIPTTRGALFVGLGGISPSLNLPQASPSVSLSCTTNVVSAL
jgi:2-polyprenyl-6-methoxyphenol hydroxylase-like FAD-dependent oxidoreductase